MLRAPVNGIVKTIHHSTVAGVVRPGDVVVELVPEDDHLVVEAQFPIHEIVYIKTGQLAKISKIGPGAARDLPIPTLERYMVG